MKNWKKLISALVALTLTVSLAAAGAESGTDTAATDTAMVGMANPWTEVASLEALNDAAGTNLQLPGVMGVSDEVYRLLKNDEYTIAELKFQVNGTPYTFRASPDYGEDISGVWMDDGSTAFEGRDEEDPAYATTDTMKLARWSDVNAQYVLMVEDNGEMDQATFESIVDEMMDMTTPSEAVSLQDGTYADSTSQRATATVTALDDGSYAIEIHWANSATEDNVWKMTAVLTEDGLLTYEDCVETLITTGDNGTTTEATANLIPTGSFTLLSSQSFDWAGAAEENCRDCVFGLVEE